MSNFRKYGDAEIDFNEVAFVNLHHTDAHLLLALKSGYEVLLDVQHTERFAADWEAYKNPVEKSKPAMSESRMSEPRTAEPEGERANFSPSSTTRRYL